MRRYQIGREAQPPEKQDLCDRRGCRGSKEWHGTQHAHKTAGVLRLVLLMDRGKRRGLSAENGTEQDERKRVTQPDACPSCHG